MKVKKIYITKDFEESETPLGDEQPFCYDVTPESGKSIILGTGERFAGPIRVNSIDGIVEK